MSNGYVKTTQTIQVATATPTPRPASSLQSLLICRHYRPSAPPPSPRHNGTTATRTPPPPEVKGWVREVGPAKSRASVVKRNARRTRATLLPYAAINRMPKRHAYVQPCPSAVQNAYVPRRCLQRNVPTQRVFCPCPPKHHCPPPINSQPTVPNQSQNNKTPKTKMS